MKKFYILLFSFIFVTNINAQKLGENYNPFIFGTSPDNPPYEFSPNTHIIGLDIDIINAVGKKLNKSPIIANHMSFTNLLLHAKIGKFDAVIAAISPSESRKNHFDFSRSYFKSKIVLLVLKKSNITSIKDLNHKILAFQSGTNYVPMVQKYIKDNHTNINTKSLGNMLILFEELKRGYIDAILTEELLAQYILAKYPQFKVLVAKEFPDAEYAILVPKNSPLLEKINKAIDELENEGELDKIKTKWVKQ